MQMTQLKEWTPTDSRADGFCPHCHLLIGKEGGQGVAEAADALSALSAAGGGRVSAARAVRGAGGARARLVSSRTRPSARSTARSCPTPICRAIRDVADTKGARSERLLMVDYQQQAAGRRGPSRPRPDLRGVWQAGKARRAAATGQAAGARLTSTSRRAGRVPRRWKSGSSSRRSCYSAWARCSLPSRAVRRRRGRRTSAEVGACSRSSRSRISSSGVAVPAAVIAGRGEAGRRRGAAAHGGHLGDRRARQGALRPELQELPQLDAVNARGSPAPTSTSWAG